MQLKKVNNKNNIVFEQRCSIREYDPAHKISREEMKNILQDAMTAPSSLNLQPWRFVVIDSEEGKKAIEPYMMFNEKQWASCSAIVVVYGDKQNFDSLDKIYSASVEFGLMDQATKDTMVAKIAAYKDNIPEEANMKTIMQDCGYVGMQLMLSAKAYGYDTNPIGGFDKEGISKELGIDTKRYIPAVLFSIGKAIEANHDSVRFSVDEITKWK